MEEEQVIGTSAEAPEAPAESTPEATDKLQQAEARAAEYLDGLQRERAAFQNYKRRVERERADLAQVVTGGLLLKLLPVLDDFDRAIGAVPADARNQWFDGVTLIRRKLEKLLDDQGVKEMQALGQPFDPNFHEAIGVDDGSDAASGTITEVLQRGYLQGDRVLRPALVRVAG
jgi:molecular chaperone GrpE